MSTESLSAGLMDQRRQQRARPPTLAKELRALARIGHHRAINDNYAAIEALKGIEEIDNLKRIVMDRHGPSPGTPRLSIPS